MEICDTRPRDVPADADDKHMVACHLYDDSVAEQPPIKSDADQNLGGGKS
jgi:hypothetical protein